MVQALRFDASRPNLNRLREHCHGKSKNRLLPKKTEVRSEWFPLNCKGCRVTGATVRATHRERSETPTSERIELLGGNNRGSDVHGQIRGAASLRVALSGSDWGSSVIDAPKSWDALTLENYYRNVFAANRGKFDAAD
jgi:hypothetical protein